MSDGIVPDDKNWTWVLERRCPECGFDASTFDASRSGVVIEDLARRWVEVLARPDAPRRWRADRWSALEYGCHVRDVFSTFDQRLALMLEQVDPHFDNWDQDRTAAVDNYAAQLPTRVSQELEAGAGVLARRFDAVTSDQWDRRGFRSDGAVFTVRSIAGYLIHDPVHHLWDVGAAVPR
jgi:hypothetical protein